MRKPILWCGWLAALTAALIAQESAARHDTAHPPAAADDSAAIALPVLAGDLPAIVKPQDLPYLVTADIIVPPGVTVTIEPGVRFLFRNFTGLQVHGILRAQGTAEKPITFTSEHDTKAGSVSGGVPAPYDWNGITVTENAVGTAFEYCRIGYSLFGINALTEYVTIKNCLFRRNGRSDVVINGVKQSATPGAAFDYEPLGQPPGLGAAVAPAQPRASAGKIVIRTAAAALVIAGCGVGIWKAMDYRKSDPAFWKINDANSVANLRNPSIVSDWQKAKDARDSDLAMLLSGFGAALAGGIGFTLTLVF